MIEKSDVFVSIDGVLKAVVKQKTPIARVFDNNSSFYIDYEVKCHYQIILQLEFHLFRGINKKNNEDLSDLLRNL
jgi:cell division protein FtsQ